MIEADRLISASAAREDDIIDRAIRPKKLADYTGQDTVCEQMEIFIEAARQRGEALDHLLIFGPPGLGKTTLYEYDFEGANGGGYKPSVSLPI